MKICAISADKQFLKIGESFEDSRWYTVTDTVKETTGTLVRNDIVEVEADKKDDGKLYLTKIKKIGSAPVLPKSPGTSKYTCDKCGKALKDDTYSSCYACNQKEKNSPENLDREAIKQATIRRQAIGHMTSRALISLQGQIEVNNIASIAETLYKKFRSLVEDK